MLPVEYHDPAGIFRLISPEIASRLPLRNLVWRSPSRPSRQIKSLHLELVPDGFTETSLRPPPPRTHSNGTTSFDIVRSGLDPRRSTVKERRHQIPGLQTSPYLKLYILRVDDKDAYKATERQKIREWIRDNAAATTKRSKGRSENHEAFEWLIIHVVIPDTVAATEPRWRESSKDPDELRERKTGMKLPGKSTRTVFDKLRADFNESGKSGQDRVAQIRLTRAQVTADVLPTPAMATTIEETIEEREKSWDDLMSRVRNMTLAMFDARVRQYEVDVAEQEARRAMPGFNFCTLFIYKEGLAMAFESVGLLEDASVIYDELSLGFETALKGIAAGKNDSSATTFAPYTTDIIDRITGSKEAKINGASGTDHLDTGKVEAFQKDYRAKIVRSDISVFDFSCYLFARQNALILRLANARSSRYGSRSVHQDAPEDLVLISEVCWRAASFIHNAARSLRQDLYTFRAHQWEQQLDSPLTEADVESLVASWTFIVAAQMLFETYSPALDTMNEPDRRETSLNGSLTGPRHAAVAILGGINAHPQRTTSLPARKSRTSELQGRDSLQSASENDLVSPPMSPGFEPPRSTGPAAGLIELVTYRAELIMMQRKTLEDLAKQRQWVAGWALMEKGSHAKMEEVDLNGVTESGIDDGAHVTPSASSMITQLLSKAVGSKAMFHAEYEALSNKAMRLFLTATQSKRAEAIMGDLAILKYQQGDFGYAASYFQHVLPFYAEEGWSLMEIEALRMHSMCLEELHRKEEYVLTLLALVAKACGWRKAQDSANLRAPTFDQVADVAGVLPEALAASSELDDTVSSPAGLYFSDIYLDPEIIHGDDDNAFSMRLHLQHLLDDEVRFDRITVKLLNFDDPGVEVWITGSDVTVERGVNEFLLGSTCQAFGAFWVEGIEFHANKVLLIHEPLQKDCSHASEAAELVGNTPSQLPKQAPVFLYSKENGFHAEILLAKTVHIKTPRHLEVRISSGNTDVEAVYLRLRPASAGLRLHLADASFDGITASPGSDGEPGVISLGALLPRTTCIVSVPYTQEIAGQEILIRLEANYRTTTASATHLSSVKLTTRLHLDVDVHDRFQADLLLSTFTLRATRQMPLLITEMEYAPSALLDVEKPPVLPLPLSVFEQQPGSLLYRISRKEDGLGSTAGPTPLMLNLQYTPVDDLILHMIRQSLADGLSGSPLSNFRGLLIPFLLRRCKLLLSMSDAELALLLFEARVPSFEEVGWAEVVRGLPRVVHDDVTSWLRRWHADNAHVGIDPSSIPTDLHHTMVIPVDVPNVDFVHDASLLIIRDEKSIYPRGTEIYTLGKPLRVRLNIITTNNWRTRAIANDTPEESHAFVYDIQADPDAWLVGGQKRGHLTASSNIEHTFDALLIPLRLGPLQLPTVDIHVAQSVDGHDDDGGQRSAPAISCETNCQTAGQMVHIVRPTQVTHVAIPESPSDAPSSSRPNTATSAKGAG